MGTRLLRSYWPEALWALFAAANAVAMFAFDTAETVPFHFIWVSLTVLYGLRVWSIRTTVLVTAVTMVVTAAALGHAVIGHPQGWDELTEVPLMTAMFAAMVWHARRREAAVDELRRTHERERDFIRDASHLLRTPIAIAQGHTELIMGGNGARQTRADAQVVLDELRRLGTISDRLLLLVSAASPRFLDRATVDVGRLVRDAVVRWRPAAEREWCVAVEADGTILADQERLCAALDALIDNALNATTPGDRISVSTTAAGDVVSIEVTDTGLGISPADLDRIFERFSSLNRPLRHGAKRGTGLGLPIVKAIVDAHAGTVAATSDPGKSTTFRIRLPGFHPAADGYLAEAAGAIETASA